jgi:ABC-type branched-subunit amino acid transport system substrate-binding protein
VAAASLTGLTATVACGDNDASEEAEDAAVAIDPTSGFDDDRIRVGLLLPMTGPLQSVGVPIDLGYRAYVQRLNDDGGVAGRYPVDLVTADSQYDPPTAIQHYNQLRDDVVLIGAAQGTPVVNALLEQLERDGVVAAAMSFDSAWIHEANLLPVGTPLQARAALAVEWALTEGGAEGATVCTFTAEDSFGEASLAGVQAAGGVLGFGIAESVTYRRGDAEFSSQIGSLQAAGCEVVFLGATQNVSGPAIGVAVEQGFDAMWLGQTGSWTQALADSPIADYLEENFFYVQEGPQWGDTAVPGMVDFTAAWEEQAAGAGPDYYGILGWIFARAVHQLLQRAVANGDLSREGIRSAMAELGVVDFAGLSGDYHYGPPEDREPPRTASIFRVDSSAPWGLAIEAFDVDSRAAAELDL